MSLIDRLRRRRAPAASPAIAAIAALNEAQPAAESASEPAAPRCGACGRPLLARIPPPGSMLPSVYAGVVCRLCGWIECKDCKGSPSDAPCTVCGSPVLPARLDFFG